MYKHINGISVEMTEEEVSSWIQAAQEQPEQPLPEYVTYEALAQAIREGVNSVE